MKLKMLLLAGVIAPGLLMCGFATATVRAAGIVVAQQQPDVKKKAEAAKKAAEDKRKRGRHGQKPAVKQGQANPAIKQNRTKTIQKKAGKAVQQQHPINVPAAAKKNGQPKPQHQKAERKKGFKKGGQPATQRQTSQPTVIKQPVVTQQPTVKKKGGHGTAAQQKKSLPPPAAAKNKRLDVIRSQRKETHQGNRTVIREQNRTIIRENGHAFIRHDDSDRFRHNARAVHVERRDGHRITVIVRPDGTRIITVWGNDGRILRRSRQAHGGREFVLYENREHGPRRNIDFVRLGPLVLHIPRNRYIVDADRADRTLLYDTLIAGPLEPITHSYTLDEIRYSYDLRERMRRVDLDTINFETGSWEVTPLEARRLEPIAEAMQRAIRRNPDEVFLVEGHTDAVGSPDDNLSLSDRRAEAVAEVLTEEYGVPPENMVTQGYGEEHLKVLTQGPDRRNRRVTVRRITPLLRGPG